MVRLTEATYLDGYRLFLRFSNGQSGAVDLADVLEDFSLAAELKPIDRFREFFLDEWPTLVWPNGFDLSPEMLYERATGQTIAWLHAPASLSQELQSNA